MSAAADALQPQLVAGLFSLRGRSNPRHFADIIINPPQAGYDLDIDGVTAAISIDFREPAFLASALGGDASRFAAAAFSSLNGASIAIDSADQLAWGLVRSYYAAFYAGHATLRCLGRSCSFVEHKHITYIRRLAEATDTAIPAPMTAGLYDCRLNTAQTGFVLSKATGRVGGAHEAFWEIFDEFVAAATEDILLSRVAPSQARAVFAKLAALRSITRKASGASWLSAMRNQIQYRHEPGVWAPARVNRAARGVLSRVSEQWLRDPLDIDLEAPPGGELGQFVAACAFITALCRDILKRIADRSAVGANSFATGPLAVI